MKKITNQHLAVAIIRVVTALSGIMCTTIALLFTTSWWAVFSIIIAGSAVIAIADEQIKLNAKRYV